MQFVFIKEMDLLEECYASHTSILCIPSQRITNLCVCACVSFPKNNFSCCQIKLGISLEASFFQDFFQILLGPILNPKIKNKRPLPKKKKKKVDSWELSHLHLFQPCQRFGLECAFELNQWALSFCTAIHTCSESPSQRFCIQERELPSGDTLVVTICTWNSRFRAVSLQLPRFWARDLSQGSSRQVVPFCM